MKRTTTVAVWVGTRKGAFVFRSTNRKSWDIDGPFVRGWEVNHVAEYGGQQLRPPFSPRVYRVAVRQHLLGRTAQYAARETEAFP